MNYSFAFGIFIVPDDLVKRIERLETKLSRDPDLAAFLVSRQSVVRLALMKGLDVLEADSAQSKGKRS
jgi:hypothetical protein